VDNVSLQPVYNWLSNTQIGFWMRTVPWAWPLCESIHFIGLSLLIGTVGLFDLRLIGYARRVSMAAFHRLIPIGVGGFLMNVTTGFCFLCGTPDQYFLNRAFSIQDDVSPDRRPQHGDVLSDDVQDGARHGPRRPRARPRADHRRHLPRRVDWRDDLRRLLTFFRPV
jgi:hypothetical protein